MSLHSVLVGLDKRLGVVYSGEKQGWVNRENYLKEMGANLSSRTISHSKKVDDNSAEEWQAYREAEYTQKPLTDWLSLLANKESRKFLIYLEIRKLLSELNAEKCLEIGAGQCHIATFLNLSNFDVDVAEIPGARLLISDIDNAPPLRVVEKGIENFTVEELSQYQCVYMVQVDYIFSSKELINFLRKAKQANTHVLMVSTQIIGVMQSLKYSLLEHRRSEAPAFKPHGYVRTLGAYNNLSKQLGYDFSIHHSPTLPTYYYVQLKSR